MLSSKNGVKHSRLKTEKNVKCNESLIRSARHLWARKTEKRTSFLYSPFWLLRCRCSKEGFLCASKDVNWQPLLNAEVLPLSTWIAWKMGKMIKIELTIFRNFWLCLRTNDAADVFVVQNSSRVSVLVPNGNRSLFFFNLHDAAKKFYTVNTRKSSRSFVLSSLVCVL